MHTPQHRTASIVLFLSIPQAPFIQSVTTQAIFQRIFSGMFLFSAASYPQLRESKSEKNYPEIVVNQYKTKVINHIQFKSIYLISIFTSTIDFFIRSSRYFVFQERKYLRGLHGRKSPYVCKRVLKTQLLLATQNENNFFRARWDGPKSYFPFCPSSNQTYNNIFFKQTIII